MTIISSTTTSSNIGWPEAEDHFLFHVRNTLAHAGFKEVGNYYKIIDYDDMRLSAFGFIEKSVFLKLLLAFTK